MGLFDKLFKRGKYPDSRMRKGARMGRVYAGPEQMRKRYEHKEEEPVIEDVYAGPDMFDEPVEQDVTVIEEETNDVETNEAVTEKTEADAVEAEEVETDEAETDAAEADDVVSGAAPKPPKPEPDWANMMAVYAGPEQMSQPQVMFVYAGPMQMQKGPNGFMNLSPNMMLAYAGPNIKPPSMTGQPVVPEQAKPEDVEYVFCPCCGYKIVSGCRFCPECGAPQKKKSDDGTELC